MSAARTLRLKGLDHDWNGDMPSLVDRLHRDGSALCVRRTDRGRHINIRAPTEGSSDSKLAIDVGAGTGRDTAWLTSRGYEVVAAEPAAAMRRIAAEKHRNDGVRWVNDTLRSLHNVHGLGLAVDSTICIPMTNVPCDTRSQDTARKQIGFRSKIPTRWRCRIIPVRVFGVGFRRQPFAIRRRVRACISAISSRRCLSPSSVDQGSVSSPCITELRNARHVSTCDRSTLFARAKFIMKPSTLRRLAKARLSRMRARSCVSPFQARR